MSAASTTSSPPPTPPRPASRPASRPTPSRCTPAPSSATSPSAAHRARTRKREHRDTHRRRDHHCRYQHWRRDLGPRPAQVLRREDRARRHRPDGPAGHDPGPARPERGRQDHGRPPADHLPPARCRGDPHQWPGPRQEPAGGPARDRRHRPVLRRRRLPHRPREPDADGRPAPAAQGRRTPPGRGAAGAVRADGGRGQAGVDLLRRHEAQARPGDDPDRQPEGDLPRRADHGPRPAQPAHDVGHHPRAGRGGDDHPAHDPVPGRGRPARAPRRGAGRGPGRRRGGARRAQGAPPRRAHRAGLRRPRRTRRRRDGARPDRPRQRRAHPPARRRRPRQHPADAAAAAGRRLGRSRGAHRAHPRSRRRLLRPHRQEGSLTMTTMTMDDTGLDTAGTRSHALVHARIMLRRNLRHMQRYPSLTLMITLMPLVFLLLFVYVFGGTLGSGLGSGTPASLRSSLPGGGRAAYTDYVAPASILLAVGFRPHANAADWLAAFGVVLLLTFAVTWLCVGLGLSAKSVETASNSPMFLILLPFLGSGFVPTSSLPAGMRWFAEYEPFTPVNETLRGLLTGTKIGDNLVITIAWCVGVAVLSYVWSRRLYEREPKPR